MTDKIAVPRELLDRLQRCADFMRFDGMADAADQAEALLREAAQPERYCNKCGYFGPDETHQRPEGGGCGYLACLPASSPADEELRRDVCVWSHDDNEHAPKWDGSCGVAWSFIDGDPCDNGMQFCPSCGKSLFVHRTAEKREG